ncbi:MAG: ABC transporter permease [Ancrocorticia sp.]
MARRRFSRPEGPARRGSSGSGLAYAPWLLVPGLLAGLFLVVPLVTILVRTPWTDFWSLISTRESLDALWLSIRTCLITTALCAVLGTPLAVVLARMPDVWWARGIRTVTSLPMMLPPVVAGLALLMTWGRNGLLGKHLSVLGIEVGFTTIAVIMSQMFVAMPFLVTSLEGAIRTRGFRYDEAALALGASKTRTFFQVSLPIMLPAFVSATALAFSRALGEFGATITFAGSLQGVTRTMPLAIYLQRESNTDQALALAVVLIVLAIVAIMGANALASRLPGGSLEQSSSATPQHHEKDDDGAAFGSAGSDGLDVGGLDDAGGSDAAGKRGTDSSHSGNADSRAAQEGNEAKRLTSSRVGVASPRGAVKPGPSIDVDAEVAERGVYLKLRIPGGKLTAIMGPNGAGKSTLLGLIAGTLAPSRGTVTFDGSADPRVVILQQNALLFPHMTAKKNVEFALRCAGLSRTVAQQRALAELAEVRCRDLAERRPDQLSGGQAQRVAIARAMAVTPDVVLLDEPMAGLDETSANRVRALLRERLASSGATAVLVTHDPVDTEELADNTVLIRHGRVHESRP